MARIALRTLTAAAVFAAILGFSRFSFGLLLPAIKSELSGSYAAYGVVAAANFGGYLTGTAVVPLLLRASRNARVWNAASLFLMALSMFATAFAATLAQVAILRFIVGVASGIAAILTIALVMNGVKERARGLVSGGIWAGGAVGLATCGALIDPHAHLGWRFQYAIMAGFSVAAILAFVAVPMNQLRLAGGSSNTNSTRWNWFCSRLAIAYGLFGFGYIVYMVYASAYFLRAGAEGTLVASSWVAFGLGGAIGAVLWGKVFDRFRSPLVLASALIVCASGVIFHIPFLTGMAVFGTPAIVSALARDIAGEQSYAKVLSMLTASFGFGQVVGPLSAGLVIDRAGLAAGIPIAAAPLVLAATLVCCKNAR